MYRICLEEGKNTDTLYVGNPAQTSCVAHYKQTSKAGIRMALVFIITAPGHKHPSDYHSENLSSQKKRHQDKHH